jgi:hypothetical protein
MTALFLSTEFHTEKGTSLNQMVMIDQQLIPSANLSEHDAHFLYYSIYFCNYIKYQFIIFETANILYLQLQLLFQMQQSA